MSINSLLLPATQIPPIWSNLNVNGLQVENDVALNNVLVTNDLIVDGTSELLGNVQIGNVGSIDTLQIYEDTNIGTALNPVTLNINGVNLYFNNIIIPNTWDFQNNVNPTNANIYATRSGDIVTIQIQSFNSNIGNDCPYVVSGTALPAWALPFNDGISNYLAFPIQVFSQSDAPSDNTGLMTIGTSTGQNGFIYLFYSSSNEAANFTSGGVAPFRNAQSISVSYIGTAL